MPEQSVVLNFETFNSAGWHKLAVDKLFCYRAPCCGEPRSRWQMVTHFLDSLGSAWKKFQVPHVIWFHMYLVTFLTVSLLRLRCKSHKRLQSAYPLLANPPSTIPFYIEKLRHTRHSLLFLCTGQSMYKREDWCIEDASNGRRMTLPMLFRLFLDHGTKNQSYESCRWPKGKYCVLWKGGNLL